MGWLFLRGVFFFFPLSLVPPSFGSVFPGPVVPLLLDFSFFSLSICSFSPSLSSRVPLSPTSPRLTLSTENPVVFSFFSGVFRSSESFPLSPFRMLPHFREQMFPQTFFPQLSHFLARKPFRAGLFRFFPQWLCNLCGRFFYSMGAWFERLIPRLLQKVIARCLSTFPDIDSPRRVVNPEPFPQRSHFPLSYTADRRLQHPRVISVISLLNQFFPGFVFP